MDALGQRGGRDMAMTQTRKGLGPLASNGTVPVYDADAHIAEPPSVWQEYADPKFRDRIMQCRILDDGTDAAFAEGKKLRNGIAPACIPHAYGTKVTWNDIVPGSYDPAARLSVMDDEGLDAALMFPSLMLISGDINDAEVAVENARAYNRWMTDFVSEDPNRLFGVGVCPLQSVDGAVAVIEEVANAGLTGITFRPERYGGLELFSPDMDRVWSAAEHHDLTVAIHGSFGSGMPSFAKTRYENQFYVHMVCHPFEQMASVMEMVASGVLDDHPLLRVGFFESGLGWLPYWLDRLDEHKEAMGHLVPRLKRDPTEIFSEQCFVTMEAGEGEAFEQVAAMGLAHTVVWGSDYPHYDCTFPGALAELNETFEGFDDEVSSLRNEVVYTNARRFMGLS
ncbi:amidohydrolase family protein [Candidatus Poriferisodalis sp.]|uniref:amidohydrolase family protein n=1 Tax=Candidatus Poriferisodalis sp. TaxID=3101277 RepID=UPI003B5926E1